MTISIIFPILKRESSLKTIYSKYLNNFSRKLALFPLQKFRNVVYLKKLLTDLKIIVRVLSIPPVLA